MILRKSIPLLSLLVGFLLFQCESPKKKTFTSTFYSLDPQDVKVEGELGRRMNLIMKHNIPNIDFEKVFLDHFRNKSSVPAVRDGFVGIGMLLDALIRFSYYTQDPYLLERKEYLVEELIATQEEDGYMGIFSEEKRQTGWDTHEGGYIILALTNDFLWFGRSASLQAAKRYADYLIYRKVPQLVGLDEGFLALYHATGDRKYVDYCIDVFRLKDFYFRIQHHSRHVYGHMERALMQLKLNAIEPDPTLLYKPKVAVEFLVNMDAFDVAGGSGAWEHFSTTHEGKTANAESCATAYIIWLLNDLIKLEGNSFYGDIMERSIYNVLFAAMSPTGDSIRYFTAIESAREYYPDDYFCCPNNYRRIISDLPGLIYYTSNKGIVINLYNNSSVTANIQNHRISLQQETEYPSSGKVRITIRTEEATRFEIKLRIPLWCNQPSVKINDAVVPGEPISGTFFTIDRTWQNGDQINLLLPMDFRFVRGKGVQWQKVALLRGPLVFGISDKINPGIREGADITIDPRTLSLPLPDETIRPGGMKCIVDPVDNGMSTITFTEFIDPTIIKTFFKLGGEQELVQEDELVLKQY